MELTRYEIYAQYDSSYNDDGHVDWVHAYTDYCEDTGGDWVRAYDALEIIASLEARVKELEALITVPKALPLYGSADDWEPTFRFFRD